MVAHDASAIARHLARQAEAVCRHYLSSGRRKGRYWLVGDVHNHPGRSLFVRLTGPDAGQGAAGKWTDAATGEHGDLLDLIRHSCGLAHIGDAIEEACRFLALPRPDWAGHEARKSLASHGSNEAARRLFAISQPIAGTLAETYLRQRGIMHASNIANLRFHPRCYHRQDDRAPAEAWPAMIAAVTDLDGTLTGVQRTWLTPDGSGKAPVDTPRRAMGQLLGNAVRFGRADGTLAAGEGIETMLSLRCALPHMAMIAALSAAHLAAICFPAGLRRLYIARDDDTAGHGATARLTERARKAGIEPNILTPHLGDFNDDLRLLGREALRASLRRQIAPEDVTRFMQPTE